MVAFAVKVTLVPLQIVVPGLADMATVGVTVELVNVMLLLFDVTFTKHGVAFDVITTETESPFTAPLKTYVFVPVPTFAPFLLHWYVGNKPPLIGVAVNVIGAEPHIAVVFDETLTDDVKFGLTVAATDVLVAVVHPFAVASTK